MIALACILARGDHAARCPRCRAAAGRDAAVRALVDAAPPPSLSPRSRDDAFERALATAAVIAPRRSRHVMVAAAGLALAAAAVAFVATRTPEPTAPTTTRAIAAGASTNVGHGRVTMTADGVAWQTGATEVYLLTGRVDVEVDPVPHRPFRVRTATFVVDVLGTVFAVSPDGVEVTRGAVRITTTAGEVIVDELVAGSHWSAHERTAIAPAAVAPADPAGAGPEATDEPDELAMPAVDVRTGSGGRTPRAPATAAPSRSAPELLDAARTLLVHGDIAGARAAIRDALAAAPARVDRARAETLLADSYKSAGEDGVAIEHYRAVADSYRDLQIGEAALYQAATLSRRTDPRAARAVFELYLARYPDGAMADKARAALGQR